LHTLRFYRAFFCYAIISKNNENAIDIKAPLYFRLEVAEKPVMNYYNKKEGKLKLSNRFLVLSDNNTVGIWLPASFSFDKLA